MGEQGILYVSKKGIYVYNLGGSVVEQLLSEGYLTGISSKTELMDVETDGRWKHLPGSFRPLLR